MKPKELSFTIDAAQMAALANAAVERDRLKVELGRYQEALHRKKVALTEYQKKVADRKAMLTHYQEICERRKAKEKVDEIFSIKKEEAVGRPVGAASSPCHNEKDPSTFCWCKSVKIGYHLLHDGTNRTDTFENMTVADAINRLNDSWGYVPLVIDMVAEEA